MKGDRLKLHLRETSLLTYCGRAMGELLETRADGVQLWANRSHICATTDRPEDVQCRKCLDF